MLNRAIDQLPKRLMVIIIYQCYLNFVWANHV